eukprot:8893942-Lingulodinium_polyedra.AAC.1
MEHRRHFLPKAPVMECQLPAGGCVARNRQVFGGRNPPMSPTKSTVGREAPMERWTAPPP